MKKGLNINYHNLVILSIVTEYIYYFIYLYSFFSRHMSGTSASPQFKGAMKDVTYVAGPGYKEPRQDWYYYNTYFIIILF